MLLISNILKNRGMKFSQIFTFPYRCFRTCAYLTSTPNQKAIKALQKFKLKQVKMQRDDGVPTYLKCGTRDKILFNITLILFIVQAINVVQTWYKLKCEF